MTAITSRTGDDSIEGLNGLVKRSPLLAALLVFGLLSLLGIEQLLSYLREEPRRWRGLRQLVQSDPQARLELARHFEPQDFAELGPFLEAYGDSAMSHVGFSWGPLIELCERMVSAPQAPGEFHFSSVARLLRNGLGTAADAQGVPLDLRERALATCAKIVDQESIPLTEGLPGDRQSS